MLRCSSATALVAVLCGVASAEAGGPRWRNGLRNPSFEAVGPNGQPVGWQWVEGRAKATLTVDETVARSGERSIKLTNPTPKEPHVYSFLAQEAWVRPNRDYVLSCCVRSQAPGTLWIGGGKDWQHRFPFPATGDEWRRVVGRFRTEADETRFRVMILTESPTEGVWVDDVMLEEGTEATEFVMDRPLTAGEAVLNIEPTDLGRNLLPNSSFEAVEGGQPQHWAFDRRNTDATMAVDDAVAHSGRRSLRFANGTPFGPHVYGMFSLVGGLEVKPSTTYTVSAWVKSDEPGVAWIGGAARWRVRCRFLRTHGQWQRVSDTFVTERDETRIPILLITESPTKGFWVDDVKLEEGNYATPYVSPEAPEQAVLELAVRPPQPVTSSRGMVVPVWAPSRYSPGTSAFIHREMWIDGALRLPKAVPGATLTMQVVTEEGKRLCEGTKQADIAAGASSAEFGWEAYSVTERKLTVRGRVADAEGRELVTCELKLEVYTGGLVEEGLKRCEALLAELRKRIEALEPRGLASRARATATILESFVPYAREDVEHGEIGRAHDAALTMQEMARARIAEGDEVLAGRRPGWPAWRYRTSPIAIDGPSFVAEAVQSRTGEVERRPIFFMGYGAFGAVRRDIEVLPAYGANLIQIEFGPNSVVVGDGEVSDAAIGDFLRVCDRAAKAGVRVNLLLSPHYFPDWAIRKWPHLAEFDGGFLRFDINAPEARDVIGKFLRHVIPRIKGYPAIHSLCLSNEPVCVDLSRSQASIRMWHEWLRAKHKTVEAMNQAWGTAYKAFEDVPVQTKFTDEPLCYDFVCFNQEQFAAWHRWMADIIHEVWPEVPVHAKIMMSAHWGRHPHGIWSVSPELFGDLSQIHGNDCCKWYVHPDHAGEWASDWLGENMGYDFQRSMGDKPIFNSENHLIVDRDLDVIPSEHVYNVLWQGAVHGMSASTTWVWERTFDPTSDFAGSIMHRPACTEAHNLACLDLNRLAREVTALQRLEPQVAVLSSLASNVYGEGHVRAMREAYTALSFCGVAIGFVAERQMAAWVAGGPVPPALRTAKLLVVPAATDAPDATLAAVARFAAGNGHVVRLGECFARNEYDRPHLVDGRRQLPGAWWPEVEAKSLWPKLCKALADAGATPLAELVTEDGRPAWGVELRAAVSDGRLVVNLANYLREPQRVRLLVGGRPASGTDLLSLREVGGLFEVPSLQPMLIAVAR